MTKHQPLIIAFALLLVGLAALVAILFAVARPLTVMGSASDNVLHLTPSATKVWVGTGNTGDTQVVGTSTGRTYLEIANISGATTTAQALYCNVGGRPSVLYEGMVIHASSSKTFDFDNLMRGAIRCRFPVASSTVSVIDF